MIGEEIYKTTKQLGVKSKTIEINISQFSKGFYLLVFSTPKGELIRKIEIN